MDGHNLLHKSLFSRNLKLLSAAAVSLALASGVGFSSSAVAATTKPKLQIVLGVPSDLTGGNASGGIADVDGSKLAAAQINKADKSVHVTLDTVDTQSSATGGITALSQMLQNKKLTGIVGIDSDTELGQAAMPLLNKTGLPTIFTQVTTLPGRGPNIFSLTPPTTPQVDSVINDVLVPQGIKSVGLIWQVETTLNGDIAGAEATMKKDNIALSDAESTSLTATDFSPQISAVLATNPGAIGIMAVGAPTGQIVAQIRSQGYKGILFGQEGDAVPAFAQAAGGGAVGFYYGVWWAPGIGSGSTSFVTKWVAAFPSEGPPPEIGLDGYVGVEIFVDAVLKADSTKKTKIIKELKTQSFQTPIYSQRLRFQSNGFLQKFPEAVKVTSTTGAIQLVPKP
jgi:ABC-type branched-subunit amino acid transport system substrate-binding protein